MSEPSPSQKVLVALRRPRDEAQLTQILAAFAGSDESFASGLARAFVEAAPHKSAVSDLGAIPRNLRCTAERQMVDAAGADRGFVDLHFANEAESFELLVELKLHSSYGTDQLDRYRASFDPLADRSALIAVTTWLPDYGEDSLAGDPSWLGSARWSNAFDAMRALKHSDPAATDLWIETLDMLREQGDFGVMDIDQDAVQGWARWKEGRRQLTALLADIHEPTLALLRQRLGGGGFVEPTAIRHNGTRLVWPWGESLHIKYAIDSRERERFRIQFLGGHDELYFTVEARHGDDRIIKKAPDVLGGPTKALKSKDFDVGHHWGYYWAQLHASSEWMEAEQPAHALVALVEKDLDDLLESGLFAALQGLPESGAAADPDNSVDLEAES